MTKRTVLSELPFWPRLLSREEAARYVGVSPVVFENEVKQGVWPPALRRGPRQGRQTWDRLALDRAADQASGLAEAPRAIGPAETERADAKAALLAAVEGYTGNRRR
jgi:hypothetical protein